MMTLVVEVRDSTTREHCAHPLAREHSFFSSHFFFSFNFAGYARMEFVAHVASLHGIRCEQELETAKDTLDNGVATDALTRTASGTIATALAKAKSDSEASLEMVQVMERVDKRGGNTW